VDSLVRTAPAGTVNGVLRLTEQGELINQGYGLRPIAMRTLERAFHALLTELGGAGALEYAEPGAAAVRRAPRHLEPAALPAFHPFGSRLLPWFQAVTPIDVITRMQIGSRPAVRPGQEGFDALRAVPWVFAWTQSRHMLPAWFGAGHGLRTAIDELGLEVARSPTTSGPSSRP
jgi:phosphoenolpyruvate carboxylase